MNLFLNLYLNLNLFIALCFISALIFRKIFKSSNYRSLELKYNYVLLICLFSILFFQALAPQSASLIEKTIVPQASSQALLNNPTIAAPPIIRQHLVRIDNYQMTYLGYSQALLLLILSLLALGFFIYELGKISAFIKQSTLFKKIGSSKIYISEPLSCPFSCWLPGGHYVFLPAYLLNDTSHMKVTTQHELQHHRQGDTKIVYLLLLLRWICFWNPAIHFWHQWISELQEFACDQNLIGRKTMSTSQYTRSLLWVAENHLTMKGQLDCAAGLSFIKNQQHLKRRITTMLSQNKTAPSRKKVSAIILVTLSLLFTTAYASKSLVKDRSLSLKEAQFYAVAAKKNGSSIDLTINRQVLKALNTYIGDKGSRKSLRTALQRKSYYKDFLESKIEEYNLPIELLALPIIESRYTNLKQADQPAKAAGIWQFIPSTAHNFGMTVSKKVDDRLDMIKASDAAFRYLKSNYKMLGSWELAVMGYNAGEDAVDKAKNTYGTSDHWKLLEKGLKTDYMYLPRFIAAIIIVNNPDLIKD